jgi:hypothetical protein
MYRSVVVVDVPVSSIVGFHGLLSLFVWVLQSIALFLQVL